MSVLFPLVSWALVLEMDIEEVSAGSPGAEITSKVKTQTSPHSCPLTIKSEVHGDFAVWRCRCGKVMKMIKGLGQAWNPIRT